MKIGKKFFVSNIIISIITMIALSFTISIIVSNYIRVDITKKLITENKEVIKLFEYKKFLHMNNGELEIDDDYYNFGLDASIISAAFLLGENDDDKILITPYKEENIFKKNEIDRILRQDLQKAYDITLDGKLHLAYNNKLDLDFENMRFSILIITLIPNLQIKVIITKIIIALIISIFIITMLSIIITGIIGRKITKPIKILKDLAVKIANKEFNEKVIISTGDEIESLAETINNMAESIRVHDIEQKKFYENISHELKTPLTVISGYAQGIKEKIFKNNEKAVDTIILKSEQLKKQIENVIYLSKLDSINEIYNFEKTSINDLISKAIEKVDSIIILNDIDIFYKPTNDIEINVDKEKIIRMLTNILSNCLKYTKGKIEIKSKVTDRLYKLEISDNGEGFSKEILNEPFSRNQIGVKGGSGIGLSIVKKIIDGHSGLIILENKKDGGALYKLEIPIK